MVIPAGHISVTEAIKRIASHICSTPEPMLAATDRLRQALIDGMLIAVLAEFGDVICQIRRGVWQSPAGADALLSGNFSYIYGPIVMSADCSAFLPEAAFREWLHGASHANTTIDPLVDSDIT